MSDLSPYVCPLCGAQMQASRVRIDCFTFSKEGVLHADKGVEQEEHWRFHCANDCRLNPNKREGSDGCTFTDMLDPGSDQYDLLLRNVEHDARPTGDMETVSIHFGRERPQ